MGARWASLFLAALLGAGCAGGSTDDRGPAGPGAPAAGPGASDVSGPRQAWRWDAPAPASVGMPASDGRAVAFTYGHLGLVLLDGEGREVWRVARRGLRANAPLLTPTLVSVATEDGVASYRRADGRELWHADLGERANSPVEVAGVLVVTTWEGSVVGVDPGDGSQRWRTPLGGAALAPAAGAGATAVATWEAEGGAAAGIVALDARSGRRRWARPLDVGGVSGPALDAGQVVAVAGDRAAHAFAAADGRPLWRVPTEDSGSAEVPPLPVPGAGGGMLVAHRLGGLVLVSAQGSSVWSVTSDGAAVRGGPVGPGPQERYALPLDDGRLLLGGAQGSELLDPPGLVTGVALGPAGALLVATGGARSNHLYAVSGW